MADPAVAAAAEVEPEVVEVLDGDDEAPATGEEQQQQEEQEQPAVVVVQQEEEVVVVAPTEDSAVEDGGLKAEHEGAPLLDPAVAAAQAQAQAIAQRLVAENAAAAAAGGAYPVSSGAEHQEALDGEGTNKRKFEEGDPNGFDGPLRKRSNGPNNPVGDRHHMATHARVDCPCTAGTPSTLFVALFVLVGRCVVLGRVPLNVWLWLCARRTVAPRSMRIQPTPAAKTRAAVSSRRL